MILDAIPGLTDEKRVTPRPAPDPHASSHLQVRALSVVADTPQGAIPLLRSADLVLQRGAVTCLVGASGSGKSLLTCAILGILPPGTLIVSGHMQLSPDVGPPNLLLEGLSAHVTLKNGRYQTSPAWQRLLYRRYQKLWGTSLGYIPQHGQRSLDATCSVGALLRRAIKTRRLERGQSTSRGEIEQEALEWLERLRLEAPREVLHQRSTALSGGMAQRLGIALALARGAPLLLADEPTSGLDELSRDSLLHLLRQLRQEGLLKTLLLVTHDFAVAEALADQVAVMHAGQVLEQASAADFLGTPGPSHPISQRLLAGFRKLEQSQPIRRPDPGAAPRLEVSGLMRSFAQGPWWRRAVQPVLQGVTLSLAPGTVTGLMGPSGVGKSTLAACIAGLVVPDAGSILLEGQELLRRTSRGGTAPVNRGRWWQIQLLHQSVDAVLHPRMTVLQGLLETCTHVMGLPRDEAEARVDAVVQQVSLRHRWNALPATLSGGELRRVGIARMLLLRPRVLIADEPTAGIDAFLRAEILDLLIELSQGQERTAVLIISHDFHALRYAAARIYALEAGRLRPLELGGSE